MARGYAQATTSQAHFNRQLQVFAFGLQALAGRGKFADHELGRASTASSPKRMDISRVSRARPPGARPYEEVSPMSACELSRRSVLAAIGVVAASQGATIRSALARTGSAGGVRIDVSPLLQPTAGWVAETLPPATAQALAAAGRSGAVSL